MSNVWVGTAADFFALPSAAMGDFNADGIVDAADYAVWRKTLGQTGAGLAADANGNHEVDAGDFNIWAQTSARHRQAVRALCLAPLPNRHRLHYWRLPLGFCRCRGVAAATAKPKHIRGKVRES